MAIVLNRTICIAPMKLFHLWQSWSTLSRSNIDLFSLQIRFFFNFADMSVQLLLCRWSRVCLMVINWGVRRCGKDSCLSVWQKVSRLSIKNMLMQLRISAASFIARNPALLRHTSRCLVYPYSSASPSTIPPSSVFPVWSRVGRLFRYKSQLENAAGGPNYTV